ncbi:MAG: PBSX family phage terminase large subunit [Candidatus Humimicrobiaceae bacterium]
MLIKKIKATRVYDWIKEHENIRKLFLIGGADSSKSYSVAQYLLIDKFFTEFKKDILVLRKTRVDCKGSCYKLMTEILEELGLPFIVNKSDLIISSADSRKNTILFTGLDERNKFKSKEFNYIWMEELPEYTFEDYLELVRRCRRKTDTVNQIIGSLNPIDANGYVKTDIVDKPKDNMAFDYSTVEDNPFAQKEDIQELEELKEQDENLYNIYRLGLWGILKHIIYIGWKVYNNISEYGKEPQNISYGIDWGFAKPAVLIKIYWFDGNKVIWEEIIYQRGLTTPAFIELAKEKILEEDRQKEFYAGTDEPGSIQQFYDAGFNIHKAVTDVRDGINYCKAHLIGLIGGNIIKEAQGYKRMEDKNGNVLEEPVKFMDHGMDGGRYGSYSIGTNYMETSKNVWG